MNELFHAAFSGVNFIPTLLLVFVMFYWLLVIIGAADISSVDFDVELDVDADMDLEMDVDADTDVNAEAEMDVSWLNQVLRFFNIHRMPLMVFVTFLTVPMWIISITMNHYLGNSSILLSLVFLVPNFVVSLLLSKPLTYPFVKLFDTLEASTESNVDLIGQQGTVRFTGSPDKLGQADVMVNGSNFRINIKTKKVAVEKGKNVLVIKHIKQGNYYMVEPYETID